jgi:hypothetical protein
MFAGLITIAGGILAASSLILARRPNAKQLIDKLTPYQGWIGIVMFFWGVWGTISCLRNMAILKVAPIRWTFWTLSSVADLVVGFLLGFGLLTMLLSGSPSAIAKGQAIRGKLAGYQGLFGLLAIAMGAAYTVLVVI